MRALGCLAKAIIGVALLFGAAFVFRAMQYQAPTPVYLSCPDCDAAGIPINLFKSIKGSEIVCQIGQNDDHAATLLETVDLRSRVKTAYCTGWVAAGMVKPTP